MLDIVNNFIHSFNVETMFQSLPNFVGSGYIGLVVAAFIAYCLISKLMKLVFYGCIAAVIWFVCMSGMADPIFSALGLH